MTAPSAVIALALLLAAPSVAAEKSKAPATQNGVHASAPRVFLANPQTLLRLREQAERGELKHAALDELRISAEKFLAQGPLSVTQKTQVPPSGDKHDYMSLAPYWWPDPKPKDGLPYIRRDGERNPELAQYQDHQLCDKMMDAVSHLSLAYYLLGDERYATHATKLLRVWFLEPATRMNPNLNYAQAIRGRNSGRGAGLIETRNFPMVLDAVGMLAGSKSWTDADQKAMQDWFSAYLSWLQHSKIGKDESQARNNHGSYYELQKATIASFTGNDKLCKRVLVDVKKRIDWQITSDGRQPLELERTKAFSYSVFNLAALMQLACLGERFGIDLWSYQSAGGGGIRKALDYLTPFASGKSLWEYQQITGFQPDELARLLIVAANRYNEPSYRELALKLKPDVETGFEVLSLGPWTRSSPSTNIGGRTTSTATSATDR